MQPPPTGHIVNIVVASVSLVQCMGLGQRLGATAHKKACRLAAGRGSLDVLKLFREQGCPWDKFTCALALPRPLPLRFCASSKAAQLVR